MHINQHSLLTTLLVLLVLCEANGNEFTECQQKQYYCGGQEYGIYYPFRLPDSPDYCGHPGFNLTCDSANTTLLATFDGKYYAVDDIDYENQVIAVRDPSLDNEVCPQNLANYTFDLSLVNYTSEDVNITVLMNCSSTTQVLSPILHNISCLATESGKTNSFFFFSRDVTSLLPADVWNNCSRVATIPIYEVEVGYLNSGMINIVPALQAGFSLQWVVGKWCTDCTKSNGSCGFNRTSPDAKTCYCSDGASTGQGICSSPIAAESNGGSRKKKAIAIAASVGGTVILIAILCCIAILYKRWKRLKRSGVSNLLSHSTSSQLSSKKDAELGESSYHTHIFSYEELQEATNGFDSSRELGDGGFGTVYKGTLRDGRTVAVKRLYENNYRRLEQFMNEVAILSRLRHQNLVTLYGCTSRHSRELLLVYEFVPNGTIADHLHGTIASAGPLPWNVRMTIAIETAYALAYLHAVEPQIIHRDVKSNNILLDNNFHVKVADFGLSRLFPLHVTHVSTAPQGTPGYVDPEYHQCYQLTDKSDVYSFGVVLVELISSKPAVDISRSRHEINLANMAVSRIQNRQLDQLVDPLLGYQSDTEVTRMITQVAELAFTCLQSDRDLRPSIKEALEVLKAIHNVGYEAEKSEAAEAHVREETKLLKNAASPFSPDSVTDKWQSSLTTPNNSG